MFGLQGYKMIFRGSFIGYLSCLGYRGTPLVGFVGLGLGNRNPAVRKEPHYT